MKVNNKTLKWIYISITIIGLIGFIFGLWSNARGIWAILTAISFCLSYLFSHLAGKIST